jgi:NodT family efflux transporter outer membrane factor (OMF) lipoprotein
LLSGRLRGALLPLALVLPLLSSGCGLANWIGNGFKVGPNYVEPEVSVAGGWIDYEDPRVKSEEADLARWWEVFQDPMLDELVERAYAQNLTLKAAAERIAGSRARRNVAFGNLFPQEQEAVGGYSYSSLSERTANPPLDGSFGSWDLGFVVGWELDFWGRYRRAIEAAEAEVDASVATFDDVLVLLLSEVATNYILYRTFQERLVFVRENVRLQEESYAIAQAQFDVGWTKEKDLQSSRLVLEQTRARIPPLEAGLRQAQNAICFLLAHPPEDLSEVLGTERGIPTVSPAVAVGIPADLVRRRPDVRRAERLVAAQSAIIGVAESDFYPRFSILGNIGFSAESVGDLFTSKALTGSIGPQFQWNILHYGRILNSVRAEEASFRELSLAYQEAVLRAGKEAEDAVVAFLKAHEQLRYLQASVDAAQRIVEITDDQLKFGDIDYTALFLFQSELTEQQDRLAFNRGEIALNLIALYRSLGGGWERRLEGEGEGEGEEPEEAEGTGAAEKDAPGTP